MGLDSAKRLTIFGGTGTTSSPDVANRQPERYDPATQTWTTLANAPQYQEGSALHIDGSGGIIYIGGTAYPDAGGTFAQTSRAAYYNSSTNAWSALAAMPLWGAGPSLYGGRSNFWYYGDELNRMWVIGGTTAAGGQDILIGQDAFPGGATAWDFSDGVLFSGGGWYTSAISAIPASGSPGRAGASSSAAPILRTLEALYRPLVDSYGRMYLLDIDPDGGTQIGSWRYDTGTGTWTKLADGYIRAITSGLVGPQTALDGDNSIYEVAPAGPFSTNPYATTQRYNWRTDKWTVLAPAPFYASGPLAFVGGNLYAFGSPYASSTGAIVSTSNLIYRYTPSSDAWTSTGESLPVGQSNPTVLVASGGAYLAGSGTYLSYWLAPVTSTYYWGVNYGTSGIGKLPGFAIPRPTPLPEVPGLVLGTSVPLTSASCTDATGGVSAMFVGLDGRVYMTGTTADGQAGDGTRSWSYVYTPTPVPGLSNIVRATAGASCFALSSDGTLYGWGSNQLAAFGFSPLTQLFVLSPMIVATGVADYDSDGSYLIVLYTNGTVQTAGFFGPVFPTSWWNDYTPPGTARKVILGWGCLLAVMTDGTMMGNGAVSGATDGLGGQLGIPTVPPRIGWFTLPYQNVVDAGAGYMNTIALDSNGDIWGMGLNDLGQLGNGFTQGSQFFGHVNTPARWKNPGYPLPLSIVQIPRHFSYSLQVLCGDGKVYTSGGGVGGSQADVIGEYYVFGNGARDTQIPAPASLNGLTNVKWIGEYQISSFWAGTAASVSTGTGTGTGTGVGFSTGRSGGRSFAQVIG